MSGLHNTTIARLLFAERLPLNILRLVADLDTVLARLGADSRKLTWDRDHVALFDMPGRRIGLAWANGPSAGLATCLTLSVGPSPEMAEPAHNSTVQISIGHHALCSRLVERLRKRSQPIAVLWQQEPGPVTADFLETMLEALPRLPRQIMHRCYESASPLIRFAPRESGLPSVNPLCPA